MREKKREREYESRSGKYHGQEYGNKIAVNQTSQSRTIGTSALFFSLQERERAKVTWIM